MIDVMSLASGDTPEANHVPSGLPGSIGSTYRIREDGLLLDARPAHDAEPGPGSRLVTGRPIWELTKADTARRIMSAVRHVCETGEPVRTRWPAAPGDGSAPTARFSRGPSGDILIELIAFARVA